MKEYNLCYYCGIRKGTTKDHVVPKSQGGKIKVPCCPPCNRMKKDMSEEEFMRILPKEGKQYMTPIMRAIWK